MREKTSKRGMPRRAAGRSPARRPKAAGPGEAGAPCGPEPPLAGGCGEEKPPPAAPEKPFDRRGKLR